MITSSVEMFFGSSLSAKIKSPDQSPPALAALHTSYSFGHIVALSALSDDFFLQLVSIVGQITDFATRIFRGVGEQVVFSSRSENDDSIFLKLLPLPMVPTLDVLESS